jgi:3-oxoacyl-[acyl-carrier-protein] synthase-3
MALSSVIAPRLRGLATCVPAHRFDNLADTKAFSRDEVRKVVAMAGVNERRIVTGDIRSTDLCLAAADALLDDLQWNRSSVDGLIMITQTPDYFMPSSSCLLQTRLRLSSDCAVFDVGLGCSGYVYGLWLASMMLTNGLRRVLVLNGETPSLYADESDRAVSLLFGDAGSATALEASSDAGRWHFTLHSDGSGADDLIVRGGGFRNRFSADRRSHFVEMNGANVFNFTLRVGPDLIDETLRLGGRKVDEVDRFVFHQSNRFIINHLIKKCGLPADKVPLVLSRFGNVGGPSIPLAITQGIPEDARQQPLVLMLLGYGVGLSWAGALVTTDADTLMRHVELPVEEMVAG